MGENIDDSDDNSTISWDADESSSGQNSKFSWEETPKENEGRPSDYSTDFPRADSLDSKNYNKLKKCVINRLVKI